jgi:hypothetical protein
MFSVGVLYSAQEFLEFVSNTPDLDLSFSEIFQSFAVASPKAILELSQRCEWVRLNISGKLEVTERGYQVLLSKQPELSLRVQIGHVIETYLPPWIPLLSRGRMETQKYLPPGALQCFKEAGLFSTPTDDIVNWWDNFSKMSRKKNKDDNLQTGRRGEKLSITYERNRTKREPLWQGFETNLAGYDLLSVVDTQDLRPLCIEVKASDSRPEVATFYISKNEWNVASTSDNYLIYLWSLRPKPKLIVITPAQLQSHIPIDQGDGNWEKASVPFSVFIDNI